MARLEDEKTRQEYRGREEGRTTVSEKGCVSTTGLLLVGWDAGVGGENKWVVRGRNADGRKTGHWKRRRKKEGREEKKRDELVVAQGVWFCSIGSNHDAVLTLYSRKALTLCKTLEQVNRFSSYSRRRKLIVG